MLRGGRDGFDRLRVLSRAKMASTSSLLDRVGVAPGARVLDVGCGSGDVTLELARRAGAFGHVTGLDMDGPKVERMWAAVRAGGALVVEDSDFGGLSCHPPNAGFAFYARTHCVALRRRGGDPDIGRELLRYFVDVGLPGPTLTATQNVDATGEAKRLAPLTLAASTDAIVADGVSGRDEVAAALADLAAFVDDPTTVVGGPRTLQVWARKTG